RRGVDGACGCSCWRQLTVSERSWKVIFVGGFSVAITHGRVVEDRRAALAQGWPKRPTSSGQLRDRDDHPDHDEHDDRDLRPDPERRHRRDSLLRRLRELSRGAARKVAFHPAFAKLCGYSFSPPMGQTSPMVVTGAARKG